jgi:hypothetical protein
LCTNKDKQSPQHHIVSCSDNILPFSVTYHSSRPVPQSELSGHSLSIVRISSHIQTMFPCPHPGCGKTFETSKKRSNHVILHKADMDVPYKNGHIHMIKVNDEWKCYCTLHPNGHSFNSNVTLRRHAATVDWVVRAQAQI